MQVPVLMGPISFRPGQTTLKWQPVGSASSLLHTGGQPRFRGQKDADQQTHWLGQWLQPVGRFLRKVADRLETLSPEALGPPQDRSVKAVGNSISSLYSDAVREMDNYIMFRIARRVAELTPDLVAKSRPPIWLSIGAPVVEPPKALVEKLREALNDPGVHTYSTPRGEKFFLNAVAQRMKNRFGVDVNPGTEACSLIGSKEGLANIFRAFLSYRSNPAEQEVIMVPDPGYAAYADAIKIAGGKPYSMCLTPENQYNPDFDTVLAEMKAHGIEPERVKALILNYPSNPIGATAGLDYYQKAVDFCKQNNILLISDLAYADVYFPGEEPPHSVLEVPGAKDVAIEFHSLSKPYATTGWRMGFAVGNQQAIDALEKVKGTIDSGMSKAVQKAAAFAMNSPECEAYALEQNRRYQQNQEMMLKGFKSLGWPVEDIAPPRATFYLWLPVPPRFENAETFAAQLLEKSGVVVVPGNGFGQYGDRFFRMSLVDRSDKLVEVIDRMKTDGFTYQ
jgi:LL-diaminopimelate aminotransferase